MLPQCMSLFHVIVTLGLSIASAGCKTTQQEKTSDLYYADAPIDLQTIKSKTCVNYVKKGDCILRLNGYVADKVVLEEAEKKLEAVPLKQKLAKFTGTIEPIEAKSINYYTSGEYRKINAALRGNDEEWNALKSVIYAAASGLSKLKDKTFQGKVYRTENASVPTAELLETYKQGNIVLENSFLSTSRYAKLNFGQPEYGKVRILYTIESKTGIDVQALSDVASEQEVIFAPGAVFRVIALEKTELFIPNAWNLPAGASPVTDRLEIVMEEVEAL